MKQLTWHNEKRGVKDLVPYELNPRTLSDLQAEKLKDSLEKFNLVEIPAIDTHNKILAGHQRIKIMLLLGRGDEEIDVRVPNRELTKKEFEEYNLRSNIGSGDWDYEMLKSFDIEMLLEAGFDDIDLSHIWDENLSVEDDEFDVDKAIAEIKTPRTKPGDLIYFDNGWHRLICGNSLDSSVVAKLVGNEKVSILDFDPIYNIGLDYKNGFNAKGKYGSQEIDDKKPDEEYRNFLKLALQNGLAHVQSGAHVFCWCDQNYIGMVQSLYQELGVIKKRVCIWVKNSQNPTPQIAFNKAFEPCVYGVIGVPYIAPTVTNLNEILNREIGTGNRLPDDILDLFNIWLVKRDATSSYDHPTQKPPSLYEKPLRRCSKAGDIALDLFAGAGPLLIAADQLKRRAFLSEIDPVFCDVIVARYKQLTGKEVRYVSAEK